MQSVQQDTPLMSALRAVLTLLGSLLIGHVVISGHPLTTDLWQLILGSAMTIVGAVTEYTSTTTTPTQMQSLATSAGAALGGVLLALGIVKQETWQSFMGVVSAILPLIHKQSTKQVAMHITNNKLTYDKALGTIRKVAVIIFLLGAGVVVHAQSPFKSETKQILGGKSRLMLAAVQPDSLINAWRFTANVAAYSYTFGNGGQSSELSGAEFGYEHQRYNYSTGGLDVLWSINLAWFPINTSAPITISNIQTFGATFGFKNPLPVGNSVIQVGPDFNLHAPKNQQFGLMATVGILLN